MNEVWVFHGAGGRFTSGVFASRTQAKKFINQLMLRNELAGYLETAFTEAAKTCFQYPEQLTA